MAKFNFYFLKTINFQFGRSNYSSNTEINSSTLNKMVYFHLSFVKSTNIHMNVAYSSVSGLW